MMQPARRASSLRLDMTKDHISPARSGGTPDSATSDRDKNIIKTNT
jgi:hypothetical protein